MPRSECGPRVKSAPEHDCEGGHGLLWCAGRCASVASHSRARAPFRHTAPRRVASVWCARFRGDRRARFGSVPAMWPAHDGALQSLDHDEDTRGSRHFQRLRLLGMSSKCVCVCVSAMQPGSPHARPRCSCFMTYRSCHSVGSACACVSPSMRAQILQDGVLCRSGCPKHGLRSSFSVGLMWPKCSRSVRVGVIRTARRRHPWLGSRNPLRARVCEPPLATEQHPASCDRDQWHRP